MADRLEAVVGEGGCDDGGECEDGEGGYILWWDDWVGIEKEVSCWLRKLKWLRDNWLRDDEIAEMIEKGSESCTLGMIVNCCLLENADLENQEWGITLGFFILF